MYANKRLNSCGRGIIIPEYDPSCACVYRFHAHARVLVCDACTGSLHHSHPTSDRQDVVELRKQFGNIARTLRPRTVVYEVAAIRSGGKTRRHRRSSIVRSGSIMNSRTQAYRFASLCRKTMALESFAGTLTLHENDSVVRLGHVSEVASGEIDDGGISSGCFVKTNKNKRQRKREWMKKRC